MFIDVRMHLRSAIFRTREYRCRPTSPGLGPIFCNTQQQLLWRQK